MGKNCRCRDSRSSMLSGLGVIGHKADIKYKTKLQDIKTLCTTAAKKFFQTVYRYVKPGGILLYSTCTIAPGRK